MTTESFIGFNIETRNYGATASFWQSLGFTNEFDTGHGSGQWRHPSGGPCVFIAERHDYPLATIPVLGVADSTAFVASRPPLAWDFAKPFTPEHWGVVEALVRDPDGRSLSLQAPPPPGVAVPDAGAHHDAKYG